MEADHIVYRKILGAGKENAAKPVSGSSISWDLA